MDDRQTRVLRLTVLTGTVLVAAAAAYLLFVEVPGGSLARLFGVVLVVGAAVAAGRLGVGLADRLAPTYNVAEVAVESVITRDGRPGSVPIGDVGASADDIVEQIERADDDAAADALVVKLNTPGGEVTPSEDIRAAAEAFDGPTVAYAEDQATSGGYWIASGCDHFHARRSSVVGSIGVNGTHLGRAGLAEKLGLDYRRFIAGEYKDSPAAWRELEDREVAYVQGLLDDVYDQFVETVVAGRDLPEDTVRDTEARVFLGQEAHDIGLVDAVGPREKMEDRLAERLGVREVEVRAFEPRRGLTDRLSLAARRLAHAAGAGVASVLVGDDEAETVRV